MKNILLFSILCITTICFGHPPAGHEKIDKKTEMAKPLVTKKKKMTCKTVQLKCRHMAKKATGLLVYGVWRPLRQFKRA